MDMLEEPVISLSETQTRALGEQFAAQLEKGDVVALYGTLGAGKTQFSKGLCAFFGIPAAHVSSPTFTLVNEYAGSDGPVYHFDAYRVEQVSEFFELGYEDYFFGEGLCIIEWPDRIAPLLPDHTLRIRFTHMGDDKREIVRF